MATLLATYATRRPVQHGDPRRIGPYRVVGRLGAGGMGTVHAALGAAGERMMSSVLASGGKYSFPSES
jgi:hypothetical protein